MISRLYIKDFALIDETEIEFGKGLNAITGETGAGKSILIDALGSALGERAGADMVRRDEKKAIIEAVFNFNERHAAYLFIKEQELFDIDGEIIIRREISAKGGSRYFINDTPAQSNIVKEFGDLAIDFHGQHEHQSLLRAENHIKILDSFGAYSDIKKDYAIAYGDLKALIAEYSDLLSKKDKLLEQRDIYEYQLSEIDAVNPLDNEDENLENEIKLLENAEFLFNTSSEISDALYNGDDSIADRLSAVEKSLISAASIDADFKDYLQELANSLTSIKEIAKFANHYKDSIDFSQEKVDLIRSRISQLNKVKKKFGSLASAIEKRKFLKNELEITENFDYAISTLKEKIINARSRLSKIAESLSSARKNTSEILAKEIIEKLGSLGLNHTKFETKFQRDILDTPDSCDIFVESNGAKVSAKANGIDKVEFYISTNIGEDVKPLAKTASGGEISRVMLSLKSILAQSAELPILVFDEIDSGISGRIARKVGFTMRELSKSHQIIAITHQAQLASLADYNIKVEKTESSERTTITASLLSEQEKIVEVAKLISGEDVTINALESAKELINAGDGA